MPSNVFSLGWVATQISPKFRRLANYNSERRGNIYFRFLTSYYELGTETSLSKKKVGTETLGSRYSSSHSIDQTIYNRTIIKTQTKLVSTDDKDYLRSKVTGKSIYLDG